MELKNREALKALLMGNVENINSAVIVKKDGSWAVSDDAVYLVNVIDTAYAIDTMFAREGYRTRENAAEDEARFIEDKIDDILTSNG